MSFENIHQEVCAALARDPFLTKNGVDIHCEDKGDIEDTIKAALLKMGIVAIVAMPGAQAQSTDSRHITVMADITVQVAESPLMNRGRANSCSAGEAARRIAVALNGKKLPGGECPVFKRISSAALEKGALVFNVEFEALTTLSGPPPPTPTDT